MPKITPAEMAERVTAKKRNKNRGRPLLEDEPLLRKTVRLSQDDVDDALEVGGGNLSLGLRRIIRGEDN